MGYSTEFEGHFEIRPQLSDERVRELNAFCEKCHGGNVSPHAGMPGLYCDWCFANEGDCTVMAWNGNEKSYRMAEWAAHLQRNFFPRATVTGEVRAEGEDRCDVWKMVVKGGKIVRKTGSVSVDWGD